MEALKIINKNETYYVPTTNAVIETITLRGDMSQDTLVVVNSKGSSKTISIGDLYDNVKDGKTQAFLIYTDSEQKIHNCRLTSISRFEQQSSGDVWYVYGLIFECTDKILSITGENGSKTFGSDDIYFQVNEKTSDMTLEIIDA